MKSSKKAGIVVLVLLGMSIFGYSQYASASQIEVSINQSELLNENEKSSNYNIELEFKNPSLLILTAGETEFFIIYIVIQKFYPVNMLPKYCYF